ncbi:ABC transporter permease, partial [Anaerosporobacter sp.]
MKRLIKHGMIFIQGFLLVNLLWWMASVFLDINVVPNPILVYKNFHKIFEDNIYIHIWASLKRIGLGLLLSLLVGIPIGIIMAYSNRANKILYPLIYFSYPIPKTALLPIAMLLWGMRDGSKIAIIFLIIVFQVIVSVRDSVSHIDRTMYQVTRSAGANRRQ